MNDVDSNRHPGKTRAQRAALDKIGCGQTPFMHPKTEAALVKNGLIVKIGEQIICQDRFGTVKAPVYEMPIPVHYQWCMAMSDEYDREQDSAHINRRR